ncbi:hypothetical protein Ahy_B02g058679 [Arachis hypogaea]|uniref:Uncharacterized protein n=1 Tax=Arachis hypogaea TaxID=3818 RepID=A0A445AF42_ARAHY|nr:hypothetical protein Ahy_B02g058679 [Arachis hypogaea]
MTSSTSTCPTLPSPFAPPTPTSLAESLILRGWHPLPRRRYFSRTAPHKPSSLLPQDPFPSSLSDSSVIWDYYPCKSFDCFHRQNPNLGFNPTSDYECGCTIQRGGGAEGACATSRAAAVVAAGVRRSGGPCAVRVCREPVDSGDNDGVLAV